MSVLAQARRSAGRASCSRQNISDNERWGSIAAGVGLLALSLRHRSLLLGAIGASLAYRGASGHCQMYEMLGIDTSRARRRQRSTGVRAQHGARVDESIIIRRAPRDLFDFWRNFENLPSVMQHLQSVEAIGTSRTHWVAHGPLGATVAWDAEIVNERPNEMIAWRSVRGSEVDTAGSVHFEPTPDGFGTRVRVELKYDPPGGKVIAAVARLLGEDPRAQIRADLVRLKRLMEEGGSAEELRASQSTHKAK